MANSLAPFQGFSVTLAASATALTAVPDNCHTIVCYNAHATQDAYLRYQNAAMGAGTAANSTTVPAGKAVTLSVGTLSVRPTQADANGVYSLYGSASGAGTTVYLTYVNGIDG